MWPSIPKALANLVIWTDANLSSPKTNQRLMDAGLKVITHEETYPSEAPNDVVWIEKVGKEGLVAFTGDTLVAYNPDERFAIVKHKAKIFCGTNAMDPAIPKADRFLNNLDAIAQACEDNQFGFWKVYEDKIEQVLPPVETQETEPQQQNELFPSTEG